MIGAASSAPAGGALSRWSHWDATSTLKPILIQSRRYSRARRRRLSSPVSPLLRNTSASRAAIQAALHASEPSVMPSCSNGSAKASPSSNIHPRYPTFFSDAGPASIHVSWMAANRWCRSRFSCTSGDGRSIGVMRARTLSAMSKGRRDAGALHQRGSECHRSTFGVEKEMGSGRLKTSRSKSTIPTCKAPPSVSSREEFQPARVTPRTCRPSGDTCGCMRRRAIPFGDCTVPICSTSVVPRSTTAR